MIFRDYTSLQPMLVLVILLLFTVLTSLLRPFYNNIITYLYVAGEVRSCLRTPQSAVNSLFHLLQCPTLWCRYSRTCCW